MSLVNVMNVDVLDNPTQFTNPFQFEITFECLQDLQDDLEWKVIYVGSAESSSYDQVLDEVMVGPVPMGLHKFVLQADAPIMEQIPPDQIVGVTVVLVTCSYRAQEFVRIGYYVNNEVPQLLLAEDPTDEKAVEMPPRVEDISKIVRTTLADKPRVTRFAIPWDPVGTFDDASSVSQMRMTAVTATSPTTTATDNLMMEMCVKENTRMTPIEYDMRHAVSPSDNDMAMEC